MEIDLNNKRPGVRYLDDMKDVLYDKEWAKTAPNLELYYMYRGVKKKNSLRYDITVIPPKLLGEEFVKTKGHEHYNKFSEVYIVLNGKAIFLIQKVTGESVEDVYAVETKETEVVIIPPDYAHFTINPSSEELKIGNWICEKCENNYEKIQKMRGACYYFTKLGWIKNKNYKKVPDLRFEKPLTSLPKNLDFLKEAKIQ